MPRHPPYALISLIVSQSYNFRISLLVSFLTNISVLFELQDIFYTRFLFLVLCFVHLTLKIISRIHIICFTMQLSMCKRSASFRAKPRLGHKKSITINSFPRLPLCQRYTLYTWPIRKPSFGDSPLIISYSSPSCQAFLHTFLKFFSLFLPLCVSPWKTSVF